MKPAAWADGPGLPIARAHVSIGQTSRAWSGDRRRHRSGRHLFIHAAPIASFARRVCGPHAVVLFSDSTITRTGVGIDVIAGGQLISYGNNRNNNNIGAEGTATAFFSLF